MSGETPLSRTIRVLAPKAPPDVCADLLQKADALDNAVATADPKKIVGAWARARRALCNFTGEDLF